MAINSRIHILKYNTYFDRIYKKEDTIQAYDQYLLYDKTNNPGIFNVDFKPTDGVSTSQIINWNGDEPNYLVVTDISNTETVISRWFVMECTRIRSGQYQLSLRRDVIADNIDSILDSTAYINKAIVPDENYLIYNQEDITTNQIKANEILLKDDTKSAWLIGYFAKNYSADNATNLSFTGATIFPDYNKNDWAYKNYIDTPIYKKAGYDFDFAMTAISGLSAVNQIYRNFSVDNTAEYFSGTNYRVRDDLSFKKWLNNNKLSITAKINENIDIIRPNIVTNLEIYNGLLQDEGKILYDSTADKYYKIKVNRTTTYNFVNIINKDVTANLYNYLSSEFYNCPYRNTKFDSSPSFRIRYIYDTLIPTLEEITSPSYNITIPKTDIREHLKDAPYDMFAMPYSDDIVLKLTNVPDLNNSTSIKTINVNKLSSLQVAQNLVETMGTSVVYDLQLLPFCPFSGYIMSDNQLIASYKEGRTALIYNSKKDAINCIFFCTASSGTKNIILDEPLTFTNKKIENQCNTYRLVSPNYNGQFEFNLARNNINELSYFNVDFTYIPYNPYIHINPPFSGLYSLNGKNFNDARGLICQGDFSVAYTSNQWINYQVQNKNYQNIFNRETQNLDYNHKLDLTQNVVESIFGATSGAASGASIGAVGGPIGAAVGGIIGGASSLLGGAADIGISEAKYGESMKYRKDIFNMKLDNVRALPTSIAKTTAFTANNKIFPILEFYTCTETEKEVVANLIANSSMKVGSIDKISTYIGNTWSYKNIQSRGYLSCQIIKLGNLSLDSHMQYTIFDEMEKGIYFGG